MVVRYQREVDRALAGLDLTNLQFMTLILAAWLGKSGDVVMQTKLARFGDIQPMQVSLMLKTLERKRLVTRPRSKVDVRAKRIEVTAAGLATLRIALPLVIDVQQRLFGDDGKPAGRFLTTLLRLDSKHIAKEAKPTPERQ